MTVKITHLLSQDIFDIRIFTTNENYDAWFQSTKCEFDIKSNGIETIIVKLDFGIIHANEINYQTIN